jgi:Tfp pilus assembly protein PilF
VVYRAFLYFHQSEPTQARANIDEVIQHSGGGPCGDRNYASAQAVTLKTIDLPHFAVRSHAQE